MSRHPCTGPGARSSQLPASPPVVTTSTPVATDPSLASGSCRPNSVGNPRKHGSCPKLPGRCLRIVEGLLTAVVYLLSINKSNKWIKHSIRSRTPRPSNIKEDVLTSRRRIMTATVLALTTALGLSACSQGGGGSLTFMVFETPALDPKFWGTSIPTAAKEVSGAAIKKIVSPDADRTN